MIQPLNPAIPNEATFRGQVRQKRFSIRRVHLLVVGFVVLLLVLLLNGPSLLVSWQLRAARHALLDAEPERALSILERAERLQPERAEVLYLLSRAHRRCGDLKKGGQYLDRAAKQGWSSEEVNQQRYLATLQAGHLDEVEPYFKQLMQNGASDEIAMEFYEAQARALLHNYRFPEAMVCLNFWIDWRPQSIRPRMWRAEIWERILYHSDAISEYARILELAPEHVEARRKLARNLLEANQVDRAREEFSRCLQVEPNNVEARIGFAKCQQRLANSAEAEKQLRALLKSELTDEQRGSVVTELATILLEQQKHDEALELLTGAIAILRSNPVAQYVLSRAYTQAGDPQRAAAHAAESRRIYAQYNRLAEITISLLEQPVNADLRFEAGRILMEQGLMAEGAAWMTTAVGDNPKHREAHAALAKYFSTIGAEQLAKYHQAQAEPDRLVAQVLAAAYSNDVSKIREQQKNLEGTSATAVLRQLVQGALVLQEGNPEQALRELDAVLNQPEKVTRVCALVLAGQAMAKLNRQQDAERIWLKAVAEDPNAVEAHRWLAMMYYDLGAMDHAQRHALRVGELAPTDPRPYRLLGLMRKDSEHYEDAIEYYSEALRRNPQPPVLDEIRLELAESHMKLGQHDAALVALQDCPHSVRRLVLEAECNFSTNRRKQAELLLEAALKESPDDFSALLLQGTVALERPDLPTAISALTRAVAVRPRDYQANLLLMQAHRRNGDQEQAKKLSQLVEDLRKLRLEFSQLHEQATARPTDVSIRFRLGQVAQQLGRPELAQGWYRAALAMDPQHDDARRGLAQVLAKP